MVVLLMDICILASGSKGNIVYVSSCSTRILIDVGMSCSYTEKKLKEIDVDPKDIDAILVTHTHSDHVKGISVFSKRYNTKVYLSKEMNDELKFDIDNIEFIEKDFKVKDLDVQVIKTSHDVMDSNGYVIACNNKELAYITDTGYIHKKNRKKLINKDMYIMECNHDIDMLMDGSYPYYLKQRILGDLGHLSNKSSAEYLSDFIGPKTKLVMLSHLSDDNNTPELAMSTVKSILKENNVCFDNIEVARQLDRTEVKKI